MKNKLHKLQKLLSLISFIMLIMWGQNAWGQSTLPAIQTLPFTLNTYTGTLWPTGIAFGEIAGSDGTFTTNLTTNNSNNSATAPDWNDEGANGLSIQGNGTYQSHCILTRANSTSLTSVIVNWTVRDISVQSNVNYIELQWANGTGTWTNVTGDIYQQGTTTNGTAFSVTLPSGANNLADLRIRWIYYEIGTWTRDRLAVDDISITASSASGPQTPTSFQSNCATEANINLTWTKPTGTYGTDWDGVVVFARATTANNAVITSTDGIDFTANTTYGSGTLNGNSYCVANQTTDANGNITITGLTAGTTYKFIAYAFKTVAGDLNNDTWSSTTTEISPVATAISGVTAASATTGNGQLVLNWSNPTMTCYDNVLIIGRSGSAVEAGISKSSLDDYAADEDFTANTIWLSGDDVFDISALGTNNTNYVVYKGTAATATITGLTNGTAYHFRIFVEDGTGTHARWSTGVDVNGTPQVAPSITVTGTLSNFGTTQCINTASAEQSYTVSGTNLTANIVITPPTHFEISTGTGGSFVATSPITLTQSGGNVASTTIYVRFKPTSTGAKTGNITHTSTGATTVNQACAGSGVTVPTATATTSISSITTISASSGGNFSADGGSTISVRGVCWNTATAPTLANSFTTDGSGTGLFTSSLTGLIANTTYYVRSYATNACGTIYGTSERTFTTLKSEPANHPTNFNCGTTTTTNITFTWTDASGGQLPDNYLILCNASGTFTDPVDGVAQANVVGSKANVAQGVQTVTFTGLSASTTYYFKVFPYSGTTAPNYKTNGTVLTGSCATTAAPVNITPCRTDVSGYATWTDVNISDTDYLRMLTSTSSTITPAMNFNDYTNETLNFTARTYGGPSTAQATITISISTDNGSNWTVLTTVVPASNSLVAQTPIDLSSYSGTQVKVKFETLGAGSSKGAGIDDICITGMVSTSPSLTAIQSTLTGFVYGFGSGPSSVQNFALTGSNLSGTDVTITASTNYEISESNSPFTPTSPITLTTYNGSSKTIYVRLKAGLSVGNYNSETIAIAGGGDTDGASVTCSGNVTSASNSTPTLAAGDITESVDGIYPTVTNTVTVVYHDADGYADLNKCRLTLDHPTATDIQFEITEAGTGNQTVTINTGSIYVNSVSANVSAASGNDYTVVWTYTLNWDLTEGTVSYLAYCNDASAASANATATDTDPYENDLIIGSSVESADPVSVGGTYTVTGNLYFEGSTVSPTQWNFDDFTDNNYTSSPTWTVKNGTYSAANGYLEATGTTGDRISTPSAKAYGEWTLRFKFENAPNGDNLRYYFIMDGNSDPDATAGNGLNGYYVIINNTYTNLWKLTNGNGTQLFTATGITDANWHDLKITRNASGLISVYIDETLKNSSTDNTYNTSQYRGFRNDASATTDNVYIDDIDRIGVLFDQTSPSASNINNDWTVSSGYSVTWNPCTPAGTYNFNVLVYNPLHIVPSGDLIYYDTEDLVVGDGTSTLSASATLTEPLTISSIWDTNGEIVSTFDFTFKDDNGSGGDANPTKISQIVFNQGTGNDVTDWTNVIAYAKLVDNNGKELVGTVNANDITFSNIPNNTGTPDDLGYIADNGSKTYTISLYLKTDLGTEKTVIDGKNLVFLVDNSSFVFASGSSSMAATQTVNSGSANNEITVAATQLLYTTNKPPATTIVATNTNVEVEATDINGNRDLGSTTSVTVAKTTGPGGVTSSSGLTKSLASGIYAWSDVRFDAAGTYTITADDAGALTAVTSGNIVVTTAPNVIWSDNCNPEHTWDLDNGSANWVNISPTSNPSVYSGNCFKTAAGNTNYANSKEYILTSEVIDLSGFSSCSMSFYLWMIAEANYDGGIIEFSTNGTSWTKFNGDLTYDGNVSSLGTTGWDETRTTWTKVTVDISSLDGNATVQFRFRFKSDGSTTNYGWAVDEMQITGIPTCTGPSVQAGLLNFANIAGTTLDLNFTRGNGDGGVLVVARQGSAVNADPVNGTTYTSGNFGVGSQIGTGNWVVYKGTANGINAATGNITIAGLTASTTYYFAIYEYNASGTCFNKTELTGNQATTCTTAANVTGATATPASTIVYLNWTNPTCFDEVLIVAKPTSTISGTPSGDGSSYTGVLNFAGAGTTFDVTGKVVYEGTVSPQVVYGLTNGTLYYFKIFTRKGSTWSSGVEVSATPTAGTLAANGAGTATAVNGTAGNINGKTFWQRNKTGQIVDFVITGVSGGWLQNVQINLSTMFSGLAEVNVAISGGAQYGGTTITRTGEVLLINNLNLTNTNILNVRITSLTTNDILTDTDLGNKTIAVQTGNTAGSRSAIASSPSVNLTIPFGNAKKFTDNGSTGTLVNKGSTVVVEGISTIASGRLAASGYDQFFIQEGEGAGAKGLCIRKGSAFSPALQISRLYIVKGPLDLISGSITGATDVYSNMTAINTPADIVDLGEAVLPTPYFTSIEELYAMSYVSFEEVDGLLMRLSAVRKESGTWPSATASGSVQMVDNGFTNDLRCYIFGNTDVGGTEPTWPKNMATLVYNFNNAGNYRGRQITPVYISMFFDAITWNGATGNGLWSDALNWSPNILPQNTDDVVFDNITGPVNSYTVQYDVTLAQNINSLRINPSTGKNITLNFPNTCTLSPALTINTVNDAIIIENGGVLNANFGSPSGNPLTFATATTGKIKINNGGKFVWMCDESNVYIVDRLSTDVGTETGIFEFDIQSSGSEAISISNRTFGSLILSATDGANDYKMQGSYDVTVRGDFTVNSNVAIDETWGSDYAGTISIAGNFVNNASSWAVNTTDNTPDNLIKFNGIAEQTISGSFIDYSVALASAGFNKNFEIDNSVGVVLNTDLKLNNSLTINSGKKFIMNSISKLTVNTLVNNGGAAGLLLKSDINNTASLIQTVGSVQATVQRYLTGNKWHFMCAPLNNIPKGTFTTEGGYTNYNYYIYDELKADYWSATTMYGTSGWVNGPATIPWDKGYIFNRYQMGNKTYSQTGGTLFTGDQEFTVTYTPHTGGTTTNGISNDWNDYDGWILVGNPYTAAIDWAEAYTPDNNFTGDADIENGIYLWDASASNPNYRYFLDISGGDPNSTSADIRISVNGDLDTRYIPAGQGFFVKATEDFVGSDRKFTILASSRTHTTHEFWKSSQAVLPNLFRMNIAQNNFTDETVVFVLDGSTDGVDGNYDLHKRFSMDNTKSQIYTYNSEGNNFALNTFPQIGESKQVPVGFYIGTPGVHTVNFTENTFDSVNVYLEDKLTTPSTFVNTRTTPSYTFTQSTTGTNTTRFVLHFNLNHAPVASVEDVEVLQDINLDLNLTNVFSDVDLLDYVDVELVQLPEWLNNNNFVLWGKPTNSDVGVHTVKMRGTDLAGAVTEVEFTITVINVNDAPIATQPEDITVYQGESFESDLSNIFTDIDIDDIVTTIFILEDESQLPAWITNTDNVLSGTPTNSEVGVYNIVAIGTDLSGASAQTQFILTVINVNDIPFVNITPDNHVIYEDEFYEIYFDQNTFGDIDLGDELTYSLNTTCCGPVPKWINFDNSSLKLYGTPTNNDIGIYYLFLIATDLSFTSAIAEFEIEVKNVNDVPVLVIETPDYETSVGQEFSIELTENSFIDIDPYDYLTYTSVFPSWLTFDDLNLTYYGTPQVEGIADISITATDSEGAFITDYFRISVLPSTSVIDADGFKLEIYPNPTEGIFTITRKGTTQEAIEVTITDIAGKKVKYIENLTTVKTEIDLSSYARGVYNIQVKTGENVFYKKLILK